MTIPVTDPLSLGNWLVKTGAFTGEVNFPSEPDDKVANRFANEVKSEITASFFVPSS